MRDALEPSVAGFLATLGLLGILGLALLVLLFVYDVVLWFVWLRSTEESNRKLDERGRRLQRGTEYINDFNQPIKMVYYDVDGYTLKDIKDKDAS